MAIGCRVGRPYRIADINFAEDPDRELYDRFFAVCRNLHYCETVVLAKACKVDVRTVRRWKEGKHFPGTRGTAILIIGWVDRGKPLKTITQTQHAAGMF